MHLPGYLLLIGILTHAHYFHLMVLYTFYVLFYLTTGFQSKPT